MLICGGVVFVLLLACVALNVPIAVGLGIGWLIFAEYARRELGWRHVMAASIGGLKTAWVVIRTLVMIGALIGVWMASGTIATIVSDAFLLATPRSFVVMTFVICALVSTVIGTSFGTLSVVGVPLMIVARAGAVDQNVMAGAIIAGIYVGDRCSPLSSSASLVAAVTHTNLYENLKMMLKTGWPALGLSVLGYAFLSWQHPLAQLHHGLLQALAAQFTIAWWQLLPAAIVIGLALLRRPLIQTIAVSLLAALCLGHFAQHTAWRTLLVALLIGFHPGGAHPVAGGGITSMLTAVCVVAISCALAGVLNATSGLHRLQARLRLRQKTPSRRFLLQLVVSLVTAAFGCNQSVAVILSHSLMRDNYAGERQAFARDIEDTSIVLAPMIPWNIAVFVPTTVLAVGFAGYLPYALFLWLLPLSRLAFCHNRPHV